MMLIVSHCNPFLVYLLPWKFVYKSLLTNGVSFKDVFLLTMSPKFEDVKRFLLSCFQDFKNYCEVVDFSMAVILCNGILKHIEDGYTSTCILHDNLAA